MSDHDHVPLICDPPPRRCLVITPPQKLSREQVEHFRREWDAAMARPQPYAKVVLLEPGWTVQEIDGDPGGWPDAEFCAA